MDTQIASFVVAHLPVAIVRADAIGRSVFAILVLASVWSWILILEGVIAVFRLKRAVRAGRLKAASSLLAATEDAGKSAANLAIRDETVTERRRRIAETMGRSAQELFATAERGLPTLAVIASTAPFVGLFGTVYGIMTSFSSIAEEKDTSLAVVAPGIAAALIATAWGLAAAIPASVAYNRLGAAFGRLSQQLSNVLEDRAVELVAKDPVSPTRIRA